MIGRVWLRRLNPPPPPHRGFCQLHQIKARLRTDGRTMEQPVRGHLPWATDCPDESPLGALSPVIAALAITSSSICSNERVMKVSTVHSLGRVMHAHARWGARSPQE